MKQRLPYSSTVLIPISVWFRDKAIGTVSIRTAGVRCLGVAFAILMSILPAQGAWRVIPEDATFPTDDLVVAFCEVTDSVYNLPADTTNSDCTAAFQAALDDASNDGGGTVFIPVGEYRIEGSLSIEANVTLRGRWREITPTQGAAGTILSLYTTNATFSLDGSGSGVRDLTFWHPEQDPAAINTNYPAVIDGNSGQVTIQNINLVNAYIGIDMSSSSMCCLRDIYGSPLKTGLTADRSFAVSRYNGIRFSPDYWAWSGLPGSPSVDGPHKSYIRSNGAAVNIKEMDGFHLLFSTISGYAKGLWFQAGASGDNPWGSVAYTTVTNCDVAVHFEDTKGIGLIRNTLEGSVYSLWIDEEVGGATLDSCVIDGDIYAVDKGVKLYNCTRTGDVLLGAGGTLTERTIVPATPEFDNTYDRVRKPTETNLFNVKDYGAAGNGSSDDTAEIQAAVAAANANGGGIVLVPNGQYVIKGNLELAAGVELRGSSGGRHIASGKNGKELGSVLLIDGLGKGDANGTPFITMGDDCGLRGISFHYVDQDFRAFIPYPYMVQGIGVKNYIIDCFASNPYQAALMKGDDHLVEYTFFGGLRSTYRAEDCSGGRIQSCHVKPDFWRDYWIGNNNPKSDLGEFKSNINKSLEVFYLKNCTNYSISSIFNHASHALFTADNSGGQTLLLGGEQIQKGYTFRNGTHTFDLINSGGNINSLGDGLGSYGAKTEPSFSGDARFFSPGFSGNQAKTYAAEGGELYIQRGGLAGYSARGAMGIFCEPNGSLTMDSCSYSRWLGFENRGTVAMTNCEFSAGLVYSATEPLMDDNTINGTYLLADMSQNPSQENGLEIMNTSDVTIVEALVYPNENPTTESTDGRRLEAAHSARGVFELEVTERDYSDGRNRIVTIEAYLLMFSNTTVRIYYDSDDGEVLGEEYSHGKKAGWEKVGFGVSDANFGATHGVDIRVEVETGSGTEEAPLLNYVVVKSSRMPGDAIHPGNIVLANDDNNSTANKIWTLSGLNNANPTVSRTAGTAIGTVSAADDLDASESFSLAVSAVVGWTTAAAQAALEEPADFVSYLGSLTNVEVDAHSGNLGVNSKAYYPSDSDNRFGDGTPEAMVFTVDTDHLTSGGELYLLALGFWSRLSADYSDFVIYDISEGKAIATQWHSTSTIGGNWKLEDGDLIVVGADPATTGDFRLSSLTLDIVAKNTSPPAAPTGLIATALAGSIGLDWADNSEFDVSSYTMHRSTTSGTGFAEIGSALANSDYLDTDVTNGITYYYIVTAVDTAGNESDFSGEASAIPVILVGSMLSPVADAFVRSGNNENNNYGSEVTLEIKEQVDSNYQRESYLRFELPSISSPVSSATLRMKLISGSGSDIHVAYFVSDDSWGESTITYSNKPAGSILLGSAGIPVVDGWLELDVTDQVVSEAAGDLKFSVVIISDLNTHIRYHSREAASESDRPELVINGGASYESWTALYGGAAVIGASTNDFDGDGRANLTEYALDGNPTNAVDWGEKPTFIYAGGIFQYVHPKRANDASLTYTVETSTNLVSNVWTNTGHTVSGTNVTGSTLNYVTNQVPTADESTFIRLKIEN